MLIENGIASEVGALCEAFERHDRQLGYVALQSKLLLEDAARLYEENAKLRELVREYAEVSNHLCTQLGGCSNEYIYCKYETIDGQCKLGKLNDKAREIGIEVTEE